MSYEPTVWKNGDVITPEKLNKIEQGVAGGGGALIIEYNRKGALDVTYQDILDAVNEGKRIEIRTPYDNGSYDFYYLSGVYYNDPGYAVTISGYRSGGSIKFYSETATGVLQTMNDEK